MDRPGVHQVSEGSGEQEKMEETGCEIICGAPTTLAVKGLMMMMMILMMMMMMNEFYLGSLQIPVERAKGEVLRFCSLFIYIKLLTLHRVKRSYYS